VEVDIIGGAKVSISPTFYVQLFCTEVIGAAFLYFMFDFFGTRKVAEKQMLVKLTKGVNFMIFSQSDT
jgi:hypothetical protein